MCMVTLGMTRCHAQSTTSDARVGSVFVCVCLCVCVLEIVQKTTLHTLQILLAVYW